MQPFKFLLLILLVIYTQSCIASKINEISQQQLLQEQLTANDIVLIDTRSAKEFDKGHIKGAINIDVYQIYRKMSEIPKDKKLVLYCRSGARASRALRILSHNGYDQLYHLDGDMNAWIQNHKPIVTKHK